MDTQSPSAFQGRTVALFAACCLFWGALGTVVFLLIGHPIIGAIFGTFLGVGYFVMGRLASEKFVFDLYQAEILSSDVAPNLTEMVQELCISAGVENPLLYVIPYAEPNALAICRPPRSPAIVVTKGLTHKLSQDEVRAVMALMIARIDDPDAPTWSLGATLAGLPLYAAASSSLRDRITGKLPADEASGITVVDRIVLTCLVPLAAATVRLAFNAQHLASVDRRAAAMVGNPETLASALAKIELEVPRSWWGGSTYNPATALLFAVPPVSSIARLEEGTTDFCRKAQTAFTSGAPTPDERARQLLTTV